MLAAMAVECAIKGALAETEGLGQNGAYGPRRAGENRRDSSTTRPRSTDRRMAFGGRTTRSCSSAVCRFGGDLPRRPPRLTALRRRSRGGLPAPLRPIRPKAQPARGSARCGLVGVSGERRLPRAGGRGLGAPPARPLDNRPHRTLREDGSKRANMERNRPPWWRRVLHCPGPLRGRRAGNRRFAPAAIARRPDNTRALLRYASCDLTHRSVASRAHRRTTLRRRIHDEKR
jgi:hypothetical protein